MANIAFGSKYFIFSKFSSIPKTSKIEQDRVNLKKEFDELNAFEASEELANHLEVGKYLESKAYNELMASIQSGKAKEQDKIKRYESQKKAKQFKDYFKFKNSEALKNHLSFENSKELSDYIILEKLVTSKEFETQKKAASDQKNTEDKKVNELKSLKKSKAVKDYFKFRDSAKLKEFNTIANSAELKQYLEQEKSKGNTDSKQSGNIKFYFKFKDSPKYKSFLAFEKSNELKKLNDLEEYVDSADHKNKLSKAESSLAELNGKEKDFQQKKKSSEIKRYYKFKNSQKFKTFLAFEKSKELTDYIELEKYLASPEHREILKSIEDKEKAEAEKKKKYEDFKNSKKYKWYISIKDSEKFNNLKKWELVFEDDFAGAKLDKEKWMTRYFWGDKLLNDAYAMESDKAFPTDGKNIELGNSVLKIVTRSEKTEGKAWKQPFGFIPQQFDFTTGLISTARLHRQKYGKFEAKIKVNYAKPVNYNFWMASEKNLPHVDILRIEKKKTHVDMASHSGNISDKKLDSKKAEFTGLDVAQDFFIYTFEWTKDKLTWKINDVVVNEQTQNIPKEEMYLVFSSSITGKAESTGLPASMEVDWVKCYQEV
ncbi:MAG: family 16 glycosylhydrolase [Bacteroidales bacterium]